MVYRYLLLCLPLLFSTLSYSATGDTTFITAHTLTNLNSPPSNDDIWAVFPNTPVTYQKIIMKFTLGCGTPNCSGWDYTVNTYLGKKDGTLDSTIVAIDTLTNDTTWNVFERVNFTEVGRLITPYGTYMANNSNGFNNSWTHPYYYDITDYASLLKDSVNVRVRYEGWTDAFSAKIEFMLIEGPPAKTVESIRNVYNTYINYPNSIAFENVAVAKTFPIAANVTSAKLRLIMTGHGSQGEFDPHNVSFKINGNMVFARLLWKNDCGMVAIAPQGGTWIFNRANWCPGEAVPVIEADITPYITPGQPVSVDLDFDDYTIQQGESAGYGVALDLITYSAEKSNDVALEEIIAPNNDKNYLRYNPNCTRPIVRIKNNGKQNLSYAEISYGVKGGNKCYYEWTGNLFPNETALITLPAFDWNGLDTTDRVFYAAAAWPNHQPDEYTLNNELYSRFDMTPKLDSVFVLYFKSNNRPEENSFVLRNENGDTVYQRSTFVNNGINRDTFYLSPGSYALDFNDYDAQWEGGDGINWWLNTQNGFETAGQVNLRRLNGSIFKNFNGDFGSNIHYEFTVGYPLGYNEPKPLCVAPVHNTAVYDVPAQTLQVYPNPAADAVTLSLSSGSLNGTLRVYTLTGRLVTERSITAQQYTLNTARFESGLYLLQYQNTRGETSTARVVVGR